MDTSSTCMSKANTIAEQLFKKMPKQQQQQQQQLDEHTKQMATIQKMMQDSILQLTAKHIPLMVIARNIMNNPKTNKQKCYS